MLVVGIRAVHAHPEGVSRARRRRAYVGVRVVAVHTPCRDDPLGIPVLPGASHVVDHPIAPVLSDRRADAAGYVVQRLVPRDLLPLVIAALAHALEGRQDAVGVVDLIYGCGALRTVSPPTGRVQRVPLDLMDVETLLVDVGQQSARRLAVEAHRWHESVVALFTVRQVVGAVVHPVVPLLGRWEARQAPARGCVQVFEEECERVMPCCSSTLRDRLPCLNVSVFIQRESDQGHDGRCRPVDAQGVVCQHKRGRQPLAHAR